FSSCFRTTLSLSALPTRRSSDLSCSCRTKKEKAAKAHCKYTDAHPGRTRQQQYQQISPLNDCRHFRFSVTLIEQFEAVDLRWKQDRKSTRLNSSHVSISYAVFCL